MVVVGPAEELQIVEIRPSAAGPVSDVVGFTVVGGAVAAGVWQCPSRATSAFHCAAFTTEWPGRRRALRTGPA